MFEAILNNIKKYKNIYIFKHIEPDGDAIYSALAMKKFIDENFKNKNVHICGSVKIGKSKNNEKCKIKTHSLGIILDTAIEKRIENNQYKKCEFIINIDHHYDGENFGNINYRNSKSAATAEMIANMFYSKKFKKYKICKEIWEWLYCGILTDSNSYSTANTTYKTLAISSKIAKDGKLDIFSINKKMFENNYHMFNAKTQIRKNLVIDNKIGYIFVRKNLIEKLNVNLKELQYTIDELRHIGDIDFWAIFINIPKTNLYEGSIRSNKQYDINKICQKYNGGGQKNTCAVHKLKYNQCLKLIEELKKTKKR